MVFHASFGSCSKPTSLLSSLYLFSVLSVLKYNHKKDIFS